MILNSIPEIYKKANLEHLNFSDSQLYEFKLWQENQDAPMIFTGPHGRGKTYAAAAFYNYREQLKKESLKNSEPDDLYPEQCSFFCNIPTLFHEFLMCYDNKENRAQLTHELLYPRFLILDDMGAKEPSPGFADFLYFIIDQRTNRKKDLTLITTNCSSREISELYGDRIASRIVTGYFIKFEGEDLRRHKRTF